MYAEKTFREVAWLEGSDKGVTDRLEGWEEE